jgi:cytokinin dehydrogenase
MALAVEGSYGVLEKTSATGPPADKGFQKIGEFLGARREFLCPIADQIQIHLHDRVDQSAHYDFPVAAGRYSKRRDNCYAFVADAASFSVQLLRQGSEAYNPSPFFACSGQEPTIKHQVSRRHFTKLAIGAAIVGFNPDQRSWVTQTSPDTTRPFDRLPKLDGALLLDEPSRRAIAIDQGNIFHRVPAAVLRPQSVQDIVAMVRYANQHKLRVAIRGDGHSRYGQTQAEAGMVIDSRSLNSVRVRTPESADAQLGAFWSAVADATLPEGLTPRVFPGTCLGLITIGGTLSAGGIGVMSPHYGALVDNVTDLDVVTGDGRLVTCSRERESELFDMVLAGQGQCGVIVRAGLPLMPAPTHVVFHELTYTDLDAYLTDQLRLALEGRFDGQRGQIIRDQSGTWRFVIEIGKFFTPPNEPNMQTEDLHFASAAAPVRMTYHDYLFRFEMRGGVAPGPSPCITMWIPASATRAYLDNILSLCPEALALVRFQGVEQFGCYPLNSRRFKRPLFKVPSEEQAFAVWLFRSAKPGDEAALSALLASNRDLLAKMTAVGGKRYAPYSMVISPAEWQAHYGPEVWPRLVAAKAKYDPNRVLSPHPAMFGEK